MIDIQGKRMCEGCFRITEEVCSCGFRQNSASALQAGEILFGKYIIGRELHKTGMIREYLTYDVLTQTKVRVKELYPERIVCRKENGDIILREPAFEAALEAAKMQFHRMMTKSRYCDSFASVQIAFSEHGTIYAVCEDHGLHCLEEAIALKEETVPPVRLLYELLRGEAALQSAGEVHGEISGQSVYIGADRVLLDGFEPNTELLFSYLRDGVPLERSLAFVRRCDLRSGERSEQGDLYAIGAVIYTALTCESPDGSEAGDVPDFLDLSTRCEQEDPLCKIVLRLCGMDEKSYQNLEEALVDCNAFFRAKGWKKIKTDKRGRTKK